MDIIIDYWVFRFRVRVRTLLPLTSIGQRDLQLLLFLMAPFPSSSDVRRMVEKQAGNTMKAKPFHLVIGKVHVGASFQSWVLQRTLIKDTHFKWFRPWDPEPLSCWYSAVNLAPTFRPCIGPGRLLTLCITASDAAWQEAVSYTAQQLETWWFSKAVLVLSSSSQFVILIVSTQTGATLAWFPLPRIKRLFWVGEVGMGCSGASENTAYANERQIQAPLNLRVGQSAPFR